jgi:flavin reductase (DIM6/NTAB) family NADH-FMN oxidoreductase RutF
MDVVCITEKQLLSRLLYSNPVCLLTTPGECVRSADSAQSSVGGAAIEDVKSYPNVMTVSWLTPVDNSGGILMCLNGKRNTAARIQSTQLAKFVLNVPVAGMENMILNIGSCSGSDINKFEEFNIPLCHPGWNTSNSELISDPKKLYGKRLKEYQRSATCNLLPAVEPCIAHLVCETRSHTHESQLGIEGDSVVFAAKILFAFVRSSYWCGKNFIPRDFAHPPFLSFLGTKRFAYICASSSSDDVESDRCIEAGESTGDSNAVTPLYNTI